MSVCVLIPVHVMGWRAVDVVEHRSGNRIVLEAQSGHLVRVKGLISVNLEESITTFRA